VGKTTVGSNPILSGIGDNMKKKEKKESPPYEAEDVGCSCKEDGFESQWEWDEDQGAYVCQGCGEVQ
jgi:hypothetical protein